PAAMRYTEARLTHLGAALMTDMDKDTVDFVPNYDERLTEPTVFPAAFPNLLVNGGTGIAVGMATNMPPHNLGEVIDGICAQIDQPGITIPELMKFIKGPDFPTGGIICGVEGIKNYFTTGKGSVKLRGRVGIEELKGNREQLVITEIPFNVNRAGLEEQIAALVNDKVITDISAMRNESDEHCRLVIELKREAVPKVVIANLFKHTQLEVSFSVNSLAIDRGRPKTLNLKEIIQCYIEHRREVVLRRTRFELKKAEERAELLEGYIIALSNLDEFIAIIRGSKNREEAKVKLLAFEWSRAQVEHWRILIRSEARLLSGRYALTERQVDAILELQLYRLTGLEIDKVDAEYKALLETIKDLLDILAKESRVMGIIKAELQAIKEKHATPRKTEIVPDEGEIAIEDLIANEGVIITLTHNGLIKRTNVSQYRAQRRGGKGVIGMTTREGETAEDKDFVEHLFTASTHDYLMFFTNTGRVYVERVHEIPDMGRAAKGRSIANLLELKEGEKVAAMIRVLSKTNEAREDVTWEQPGELFFATQQGTVKKTALHEFANVRKGGIIAISIDQGDTLIDVKQTRGSTKDGDEGDDVVLITRDGMSIRFSESDVRSMGRAAAGVKGITLEKGDAVVALAVVVPDAALLVAGENGVGKRTSFDEYLVQGESGTRKQSRGGKGRITMKVGEKTGGVIGALPVRDTDEIMLITVGGQMVRTFVKDIREAGRNTMGVKLVNLDEGDKLQAIAPVISELQEDAATDVEPAA
ncbi:MAG: DNA gyrase subunit A, partial [Verrucomicrobia bacterium]|nr:DNA gyrase subunit A [Verrucomicrobiota bacterium]